MKANIIENMIDKVLYISDEQFKKENIRKIEKILCNNDYPKQMTKRIIKRKLFNNKNALTNNVQQLLNNDHATGVNNSSMQNNIQITSQQPETNNVQQNEEPEKVIYGSITYIPNVSEKIVKILKESGNKTKIAQKPCNKNKDFFSNMKCKKEKLENTDVVYQFQCDSNNCSNKLYIGNTCQQLKDRLYQHKNNIKKKDPTAVSNHHTETGHTFAFDKVKILHYENKTQKREFLEASEIYVNRDHAMNKKTDTQYLHHDYKHTLDFYNIVKNKKI